MKRSRLPVKSAGGAGRCAAWLLLAMACAPASPPAGSPSPPADSAPAVPPFYPGPIDRLRACVIQDGELRWVTVDWDVATSDTVYNGQPFHDAFPITGEYAAAAEWFANHEPLLVFGTRYVKYGLPRILGISEVTRAGEYRGVPIYAESGTTGTPDALYLPVRTGCEFQPYERSDHASAVRGG